MSGETTCDKSEDSDPRTPLPTTFLEEAETQTYDPPLLYGSERSSRPDLMSEDPMTTNDQKQDIISPMPPPPPKKLSADPAPSDDPPKKLSTAALGALALAVLSVVAAVAWAVLR